MNKAEILRQMYKSVDKMNQFLITGDTENATRERVAQKALRRRFEWAEKRSQK